jgi:Ca-activated chloride channel family protein
MEYQTFANTQLLQTGYEFIPFGVRHDNPLYAVGDLGVDKLEVLDALAKHATGFAALATRYGFNSAPDHRDAFAPPPGELLVQAQQTWKQKKNAGRPVAAVFLSDISGSMAGSKIRGVREALRKGIEFVSPENSIGLVLFSDVVTVALPIKKFDLNHRATFLAAVRRMDTGGGTAMYDGIAVALSLLVEEQKKNPDVKPMLLTLSDGVNKDGLAFEEVVDVVRGLRIPVYTIGFEANIPELKRVSSLVEAATIDAKEGDIAYKIGTLLNAQL